MKCKTELNYKICELFNNRKYDKTIKLSTEYLDEYGNDIKIRYLRGLCYRANKKYDKAIEDFKYNTVFSDGYNTQKLKLSFLELYFLYYKLGKYADAYKLISKLKEFFSEKYCEEVIGLSECIIEYKLGICDIEEKCHNKYIANQLKNYNEQLAITHIINQNCINKNNTSFQFNVNVKYLFDTLKNTLNNYPLSNSRNALDLYYFSIAGIGIENSSNSVCNILKVAVEPMTRNIISMYPVQIKESNFTDLFILDIDYEKLFNRMEKQKIKTMSQIDKFNKRYSR